MSSESGSVSLIIIDLFLVYAIDNHNSLRPTVFKRIGNESQFMGVQGVALLPRTVMSRARDVFHRQFQKNFKRFIPSLYTQSRSFSFVTMTQAWPRVYDPRVGQVGEVMTHFGQFSYGVRGVQFFS